MTIFDIVFRASRRLKEVEIAFMNKECINPGWLSALQQTVDISHRLNRTTSPTVGVLVRENVEGDGRILSGPGIEKGFLGFLQPMVQYN